MLVHKKHQKLVIMRINTGLATIIAAVVAVAGISLQLDASRKAEELKSKKEVYIAAFESINDVLGNVSISPGPGYKKCPPSNPGKYDLTKARAVMDRILMFSDNPIEVAMAYQKVLGINQSSYRPTQALAEFRDAVLRDIGKSDMANFLRSNENLKNNAWISTLPHPETKKTANCIVGQLHPNHPQK